jgi:hypothetical protein
MKKTCENVTCGKKFEGNAKARFCSPSCRVAANRAGKQISKATNTLNKKAAAKKKSKVVIVVAKGGKIEVPADFAEAMNNHPLNADAPQNKAKLLLDAPIPEWVERVEKFCNKNDCTVDDLIDAYKNRGKKPSLRDMMDEDKKNKKGDSKDEPRPIFNRRKTKLGF